jgi:acyl-CoA thioester hydrolase
MLVFSQAFRIRYADTDKMGYCYYGRYAEFFEVARVEALRSIGISYKHLEDEGIMLPVLNYNVKYIKPAYYDEPITVKTTIKQTPTVKFSFFYETYNSQNELINTAETTLVFTNLQGKPIKAPAEVVNAVNQAFEALKG